METIGRTSISFNEDYKTEFLIVKDIPNRSKFICETIRKFIADDNNLSPIEKFIKEQILLEN